MVAIYSTLREDLYVVYAGQSPGDEVACHSRVLESAGEVDLVRRRYRCFWHASGTAAESSSGFGFVWREEARARAACARNDAVCDVQRRP